MSTGLKIFAIYDKKVAIYRYPHFHQNIQDAVRQFQQEVKNPQNPLSQYPEDFDLYQIGQFDETTANIVPVQPAFYIESAINLIPKEQKINGSKN